jgi:hypothetical protein
VRGSPDEPCLASRRSSTDPQGTSGAIDVERMIPPVPDQVEPIGSLDHVMPAPLVARLLHQAKGAVASLDVVVGAGDPVPTERHDQFLERRFIPQPLQCLLEQALPAEAEVPEQTGSAVPRSLGSAGPEDSVEPVSDRVRTPSRAWRAAPGRVSRAS